MKNDQMNLNDFLTRLNSYNEAKRKKKLFGNNRESESDKIKRIQESILLNLRNRNQFNANEDSSNYTIAPSNLSLNLVNRNINQKLLQNEEIKTTPPVLEIADKPALPPVQGPIQSPSQSTIVPGKEELKRNIEKEWEPTPGAFYEKGIDNISDLSGYNVYDAPKGYKWTPVANPGYVGPFMPEEPSVFQLFHLFSDTESTNSRPDPQYAYRWGLQRIDEQPTSSGKTTIDNEKSPTNTGSNIIPSSTIGSSAEEPPKNGILNTVPNTIPNNNELALYGAPVPMMGTLQAQLSASQGSPTPQNNQAIASSDLPRRQGNAGIGTLGDNISPSSNGSFKQTPLYSLFAKPQTNNASTNNFMF